MFYSDEKERVYSARVNCVVHKHVRCTIHARPIVFTHSFPMDIQILELMDQELKSEIVAKAQTYEIFVLLGQVWTEYMQKYYTRAKKYIKYIAEKPYNDRKFVLFGWFRTIAQKYYVHIAVEPCIDTDLKIIKHGSRVSRSHQLQCIRTINRVLLICWVQSNCSLTSSRYLWTTIRLKV